MVKIYTQDRKTLLTCKYVTMSTLSNRELEELSKEYPDKGKDFKMIVGSQYEDDCIRIGIYTKEVAQKLLDKMAAHNSKDTFYMPKEIDGEYVLGTSENDI